MQPSITDIWQLYSPIQAGVNQLGDQAIYSEFLPAEELRPFIYCYWELKTLAPLKRAISCNIVSDGCMDIFFELDKPQHSYAMGSFDRYTDFTLGKTFHYFGIRFLPTAFPQLFKISASALSNQIRDLSVILPAIADLFVKNFDHSQNIDQIKPILDKYLTDLALKANFNDDPRLYETLTLILKKTGMVNVESDLELGISSRHLQRLFKHYVGNNPKTFSKVVRFQHILQNKPTVQQLRESKMYLDFGYYDQSHFINDFKHYYGITPAKAF